MDRIHIIFTSLAATIIFSILLYLLQLQSPILFWTLYILLSASVFFLELSTLTQVLDQLSFRPVLAITLVLVTLSAFVVIGLIARALYADALMYWLYGTIFPAVSGILYIIDILQAK